MLVYQETYHQEDYKKHHPKGKKSNFHYRLDTPDRLGRAGIHKMGLGVLFGLEDWRTDSYYTALHLSYLERTYGKPNTACRFRACARPKGCCSQSGAVGPGAGAADLRLPPAQRGSGAVDFHSRTPTFRDHIIRLGITSISAGSKTNPGGYSVEPGSLEQFEVSDERSPAEIAAMIRRQGYEPVWKDWDPALTPAAQQPS